MSLPQNTRWPEPTNAKQLTDNAISEWVDCWFLSTDIQKMASSLYDLLKNPFESVIPSMLVLVALIDT